jgi:bifunctional non-homologous end joining protein LigD
MVAGVSLSSPTREVFPELGITKLDLARYYEVVAEWLLPYWRDRPLALVRCPDDYRRCFFQKHLEGSGYKGIHTVPIRERGGSGRYGFVTSPGDVLSLVQMGAVEFHTWGCRRDRLEQPDRLTVDLDPDPSLAWSEVVDSAHQIRQYLSGLGLTSFVKTTGGKGLHVVVPVQRRRGWDQVLDFSRALAKRIVDLAPGRYTSASSKARRKGRIFVDYLRNGRGSICVESYSVRARATAPVATPLSWDELTASIKPESLNLRTLPKRLASLGADPWEGYTTVRQSLTAQLRSRV